MIPRTSLVLLLLGVAAAAGAVAYALIHREAVLVSVMVDNHQTAREYQRGLEKALFIQEQLVEGFITRFEAVYDIDDLPASIGPVRSVRPYFIDGVSPLVSAIFHAGGSPEALERLRSSTTVTSFNALLLDASFAYDPVAPAPHHRFITRDNLVKLAAQMPSPRAVPLSFFRRGRFTADEPAKTIGINYHSPVHNVRYTYDLWTKSYIKENRGKVRPLSPRNILILETGVEVIGPLGRLEINMQGKGSALLFRDGSMVRARWSKKNDREFFTFTDASGQPLSFQQGQVWMIVLDSLDRVSWENTTE